MFKRIWFCIWLVVVLCASAACASPTPTPTATPVPTTTVTPPPMATLTLVPTATLTLTPTPTYTPSPTPRPTADLVLSEEFSDPSSWWCEKETGAIDWYCQDGELHVVTKSQPQFRWKGRPNSYGDFIMQVQVRFIGDAGAAALVFRASAGASPSMYVSWVFPTGRGALMKYVSGNRMNLIEPTELPAIKKGEATNTLRIVAQGSRFTFYANDVELAHLTDATYSEGVIGIGAADGAHVVFDNLKIWVPLTTDMPILASTPNPYIQSNARLKYSFDEIWPHLNTPSLVLAFMQNNLKYGGDDYDVVHYGGNTYATAQEVYTNGEDDCDGLAEFGACVLSKHGFEAYNVGILGFPLGHNVTGFVNPSDGKIYAISNGREQVGPFGNWVELAQYFIDRKAAEPNGRIWLFYPCISQTTKNIDALPHKVIR